METKALKNPASASLHVLLIGNNPIELSSVLDKLQAVRGKRIITEIAFDLKSLVARLITFNPNFIFIDDNLGKSEFQATVSTLTTNQKTKNIPITVLKSSNYQEASGGYGILDYLLKNSLSTDSLFNNLKNSLKFRRTQRFLTQIYQQRKNQGG